tara:strand:- start:454 stop:1926 length:1473 start_codon:yes stop_codon:yes gene_type:complete
MPRQIESFVLPHTDNRARVFKRNQKNTNNSYYYIKIRKPDGKYTIRSAKTDDLRRATNKAEALFREMRMSELRGLDWTPEESKTIEGFYKKFIASLSASKKRIYLITNTFERCLLPHFGKKKVEAIRQSDWNEYEDWRLSYYEQVEEKERKRRGIKKTISRATLFAELQMLLQMIRFLVDEGYVAFVPKLKVRKMSGIRTRQRSKTISESEWNKIREKLFKSSHYPFQAAGRSLGKSWEEVSLAEAHDFMVSQVPHKGRGTTILVDGLKRPLSIGKSHYFSRLRTFYSIMICYHSGIRPSTSELCSITWRHINLDEVEIKSKKIWVALLKVDSSKKDESKSRYLSQNGTLHLLRWLKICKKFGVDTDKGFVFPRYPSGKKITGSEIGQLFSIFLKGEGLKKDSLGRSITLYSYARHQAIASMLKNWDLTKVAVQADCSVLTLSTHYADEIMRREPEKFASREKNPHPIDRKGGAYKALQTEVAELRRVIK